MEPAIFLGVLFMPYLVNCAPLEIHPTVVFKKGQPLDVLPGAAMLKQLSHQPSVQVTLTPVNLQGPEGQQELINFVTPVYRNDITKEHNVFGPTLRARGGDTISIVCTNNLTQYGQVGAPISVEPQEGLVPNAFMHAGRTNLHAHGMHVWPGVETQSLEAITNYHGGDNIFPTYEPRNASEALPAVQNYTLNIGWDHMPGLYWYHPHHHGSTVVQVPTANGLIVIEENERWLPKEAGCGEVHEMLLGAPEVFIHLSLYPFAQPNRTTRTANIVKAQDEPWAIERDDTSLQNYNEMVQPENPTAEYGVSGLFNSTDFLLVNGAYQPVIEMTSGQYQRWRVASATTKRFEILQIIDPRTQKPAPQCELLLLAKDGHFLMQIPRLVNHIFLATGNRAELLVKCEGAVGDEFVLGSGDAANNPYGAGCNFNTPNNLQQRRVASIVMTQDGQSQSRPALEGCTPRRAGYSQDLRDESLARHNATEKLIQQPVTLTMNGAFGCQVNGANFSLPDPDPLVLPLGSVVEWVLEALPVHPLHLHVNPMQIIELPPDEALMEGCSSEHSWWQVGDLQDTLNVPVYQQDQTVRVRMQPGEYSGLSVMHCHALQHEDLGCMKAVFFTCPGMNATETHPKLCPGFTFPVPGNYPSPE